MKDGTSEMTGGAFKTPNTGIVANCQLGNPKNHGRVGEGVHSVPDGVRKAQRRNHHQAQEGLLEEYATKTTLHHHMVRLTRQKACQSILRLPLRFIPRTIYLPQSHVSLVALKASPPQRKGPVGAVRWLTTLVDRRRPGNKHRQSSHALGTWSFPCSRSPRGPTGLLDD